MFDIIFFWLAANVRNYEEDNEPSGITTVKLFFRQPADSCMLGILFGNYPKLRSIRNMKYGANE
jgi:hypothetical protein